MSSSGIVSDPRRSPGPGREEKKAEVRRRILEASKEIFFRDGFMDANLDEIAELAGVAKGTLYRYFDNKAQIYLAVLSRKARRFEKKLQDSLDPQATPVDALVRVSRFYFQHYVENPDYFQIFWAIENQAVIGELPPEVVEEVVRLWEESLGILAGGAVLRRCHRAGGARTHPARGSRTAMRKTPRACQHGAFSRSWR